MPNMRDNQVARAVARVVWAHRDDDKLCAFYFHKLMEHIRTEMVLYERQISRGEKILGSTLTLQ